MDAQSYNAALADLRTVRDQNKKTRAALVKLETDRDRRIIQQASYEKAKAERIAPTAGLGVADVVALAPTLAPDSLAMHQAAQPPAPQPPSGEAPAQTAAYPPQPQTQVAAVPAATAAGAVPDASDEARTASPGLPAASGGAPRELPSIPAGPSGDAWFAHTPGLASTRPNFTQQARSTAFLDADNGVLVHRSQTHHLDLASRSAEDILTAVFHTIPESVERIYITAGDPWHRDADRYPYLHDAVAAWRTDTGRGRDRMAGHFVHARNPVARCCSCPCRGARPTVP